MLEGQKPATLKFFEFAFQELRGFYRVREPLFFFGRSDGLRLEFGDSVQARRVARSQEISVICLAHKFPLVISEIVGQVRGDGPRTCPDSPQHGEKCGAGKDANRPWPVLRRAKLN